MLNLWPTSEFLLINEVNDLLCCPPGKMRWLVHKSQGMCYHSRAGKPGPVVGSRSLVTLLALLKYAIDGYGTYSE